MMMTDDAVVVVVVELGVVGLWVHWADTLRDESPKRPRLLQSSEPKIEHSASCEGKS